MLAQDQSWQAIAKQYRVEAAAKIPKPWRLQTRLTDSITPLSSQSVLDIPRTCDLLTEREISITERYDGIALLERLANGTLSSYSVTLAFCKPAAIAQQLVSHSIHFFAFG